MNLKGVIKENFFFLLSILLFLLLSVNHSFSTKTQLNFDGDTPVFVRVKSYPVVKGVSQMFNAEYIEQGTVHRVQIITIMDNIFNINDLLLIKVKNKSQLNSFNQYSELEAKIYYPEILIQLDGGGILNKIGILRNNLLEEINRRWHGRNAALLAGLLIGADYDYSPDVTNMFKATLTMHILVVSGFNVGFINSIIMKISPLIGRRKNYLISIIIISLYTFIVGIDNIPCQRAFIMIMVEIMARLAERRIQRPQLWGITLIIILLINPDCVDDISMHLSFLASFAVLIHGYIKEKIKTNWIIEGMIVTLLCNIFTLPILLQFGNKPTIGSLITNIFIAPFIPAAMILGGASIFITIISPQTAGILSMLTDLILELIFLIVFWGTIIN
jgi:ComEC/Rec2-related protein